MEYICSDFDSDCFEIDHWDLCAKGTLKYDEFGNQYYTPPCDGYCPFINNKKEALKELVNGKR